MSDDHEISEELIERYRKILKGAGLSDCPYNITACRMAIRSVNGLCHTTGNDVVLRTMQSEVLGAPALFVGVELEDGFAPIFLVMTSEFIGSLRLSCSEGCDHSGCMAIPEDLRNPPTPRSDTATADASVVNELFAPIVDSLGGELPSYEDLAGYYIVESRDEEGGE